MRTWQTIRTANMRRHVHTQSYAAIVLSGQYEEAGDSGHHTVSAGDVLLHDAFEAHLNRVGSGGAQVLNVRLPDRHCCLSGRAHANYLDHIVALAEQCPAEAATVLVSTLEPYRPPACDWPDELAADLVRDASVSLAHWGASKGIPAWQLSRGFAQVFGISPSAFRARARTRQAWRTIRTSDRPLAIIAADCGFSDQAHMTRSITRLTGRPPVTWRDSANRFKTP